MPALGRSRGGLTSRIHLICDALRRPLGFVLTGDNANDCTQFTAVMEAIRAPRLGPGRPRLRSAHVLGDKGYSSRAIRTRLRRRGIAHHSRAGRPETQPGPPRQPRRTPAPLRQAALLAARRRGTVLNRLKQWRGIATRCDKTAESYQAAVTLASLLMWA
ncbi:IS5 family transposase [Streptomyces sp. NPDC056178]|uniref:IS5 family transposase n=1 Tax=Streptomyces sp. NPDC056178 TaxID=3345735 RepID=UPI0035E20317